MSNPNHLLSITSIPTDNAPSRHHRSQKVLGFRGGRQRKFQPLMGLRKFPQGHTRFVWCQRGHESVRQLLIVKSVFSDNLSSWQLTDWRRKKYNNNSNGEAMVKCSLRPREDDRLVCEWGWGWGDKRPWGSTAKISKCNLKTMGNLNLSLSCWMILNGPLGFFASSPHIAFLEM